MYFKSILLVSTLTFCYVNGAVLLWSNNKFADISPLRGFSDENLEDLVKKMGYPEVTVYKSSFSLLPELEVHLNGYYTAYNPNGDISTENATEISGQDLSLLETKQRFDLAGEGSVLSVLVLPNGRSKREVTPGSSTTETSPTTAKGPVLYKGKSKKDIYTLLYSSQPLLLRTSSNSSNLELGQSTMVTVNTASKDPITKLFVKVRVGEDNNDLMVLQFFFVWSKTYWSLKAVNLSSLTANYSANLNIVNQFSVPAHFSYHCNGVTVFADTTKTTELLIYDMQVQIDSKNGAFDDAYDCVDFMTVPIWSGLFVTALLGVGLIIALTAISEIKTMDKFDNPKTKPLVITVAE